MTVYLVDDDKVVLIIIERVLTNAFSAEVKSFENPIELLEELEKEPPEAEIVVLTDLKMPQLSGFQVIKSVKSLNKKWPIIILSSEQDDSAVEFAFKSGADNYIFKPVKRQRLIEVMEEAINKYKSE